MNVSDPPLMSEGISYMTVFPSMITWLSEVPVPVHPAGSSMIAYCEAVMLPLADVSSSLAVNVWLLAPATWPAASLKLDPSVDIVRYAEAACPV